MIEPSDTDFHECPENVQEYIKHLQSENAALEREKSNQFIWGMMKALNDMRLEFWGIGYDKDETASKVRRVTCERFSDLKEMMCVQQIGDEMFSDATDVFERLRDGKSA